MSEIEMLLKVRDGLAMAVEGLTEYIEAKAPVGKRWDPNKIKWVEAEGTKGPYEKTSNEMNEDTKNMLQDLKDHDGKMYRDGYFYWVFNDAATVGRKKKVKK